MSTTLPQPGAAQTVLPEALIPSAVRVRLLATLFVGQSLFSASQIMTFAALPILAVELAGNDALAGVPATVTLLGRAAAAYPIGWLMDRYGRRAGLSTGFLLAMGGFLLSALAAEWASLLGFLLGALMAGMGRGIGELARYAAAEVELPDRRAKAIGFVVFAGTVGAVVGPRLLVPAEQLAQRFGWISPTGPFVVGAGLAYLAFMLNALLLRPDPMRVGQMIAVHGRPATAPAAGPGRAVREIFSDWTVRLALVAMVIGQLVMTVIMVITPLYMSRHDYDTDAIAWVFMGHTLGMFGLASVTGWLIDRVGQVPMIIAGGLILALSAVLTPLAGNVPLLAAALFLLGLGWNFCYIAGSAMLAGALQPEERGRVQGASETLVSLASGLGSISTGAIFAQGGITGISAAGLACSVALLLITVWIARFRVRPLAAGGA
ncbi:MAG TPA: MFS transporter [Caldilineaceae bacterium]|nr:MFS transporter [Caldilineaceae bacterium]